MSRANQTKYDASEVQMERAANGWIVSAKYNGLYDTPPSIIAPTVEAALVAAKDLMTKPFVRSDDY
jgi:hypothetical protein